MRKDAAAIAREVLDGNLYMTLATADAAGRPWATPVFFTADGPTRFYWVSSPDARHSRNITERPEVGIVVFDSQVPVGGAEAVYMTGTAALVGDDELEVCAGIYGTRRPRRGASARRCCAPRRRSACTGRQSSATTSCCAAVIPRTPAARDDRKSRSSCGEQSPERPKPAR